MAGLEFEYGEDERYQVGDGQNSMVFESGSDGSTRVLFEFDALAGLPPSTPQDPRKSTWIGPFLTCKYVIEEGRNELFETSRTRRVYQHGTNVIHVGRNAFCCLPLVLTPIARGIRRPWDPLNLQPRNVSLVCYIGSSRERQFPSSSSNLPILSPSSGHILSYFGPILIIIRVTLCSSQCLFPFFVPSSALPRRCP